jgi:hypothetical protein
MSGVNRADFTTTGCRSSGLEQTKHFQNHNDDDNHSDDIEDVSVHGGRE